MFYVCSNGLATGTDVGSNPAVWFVAVASTLIAIRFWIIKRREVQMADTNTYRKIGRHMARMKSNAAAFVSAVVTITLAIATDWTAELVTHPLHTKGAPRWVERPFFGVNPT
jgi:hypothetical protein